MQSLLFLEKGFLSVRYTPGGLTHGILLEEKLAGWMGLASVYILILTGGKNIITSKHYSQLIKQ
jgi:hypothetical protein